MILHSNPQLELAFEYVRNTRQSVFLTGKAGTGKTTFLQKIKDDGSKRMAIVAPTGVAAINAGGMTIHSLFQLPLGIFLPGVERNEGGQQRRFKREKIRLIRSLDLLVIDEISMVRADLLDAVDEVLRRYRDYSQPFGGVQLLMIGDLHQLPPVVKPEDWTVLSRAYETPYFFGSRALQQTGYVSIELQHIYRQSDLDFIALLNKVRNNVLDEDSLRLLNSRFIANFRPPANEPYITLTATNAAALEINVASLARLRTPSRTFKARITGEFPPSSYPTEETLEFKQDAQVMFIRNDQQTERRYFNGKIGRITRVEADRVYVRCPGDLDDIEVIPSDWENVKYTLNEESRQIDEKIIGTFSQLPLKLAWAITIHKSQGLTFERAIVDAEAAFAHGQVYVALSRCKSFEGIVLRSRIRGSSVKTDPVVRQFTEEMERQSPSETQLLAAKRECQITAVRELFGFDAIERSLATLQRTCSQHETSFAPETLERVRSLAEQASILLFDVARKFSPQLGGYLAEEVMPESNEALQSRIKKASVYFTTKLEELSKLVESLSLGCDNQEVGESLVAQRESLRLALFVKRACFVACGEGFATEAYNRALTNAELDFQLAVMEAAEAAAKALAAAKSLAAAKALAAAKTLAAAEIQEASHATLYGQLVEWRERQAQSGGLPEQEVIPDVTLRELVDRLPTDDAQLRTITGIGKGRRRRYGAQLIELIRNHTAEQLRRSAEAGSGLTFIYGRRRSSGAGAKKGDSQRLSLELFRAGKNLDEIAKERGYVRSTIESHLSHYIAQGELKVSQFLSDEKVAEIEQFLAAHPEAPSSEAKAHFGDKYSYGELKMMIAHMQAHGRRAHMDETRPIAKAASSNDAASAPDGVSSSGAAEPGVV